MQALVSKLMMALVLAQALSGWCCHRPCHCLDGETEVTADQCCQGHDHEADLQIAGHCQCHECLGFCTYVGSAKHVVRPMAALPLVVTAHGLQGIAQSDAARLSDFAAASGEVGPPVGLHLLHRSLLI